MSGGDIKIEIQHLTMAYGSYVIMQDLNARVKRGSPSKPLPRRQISPALATDR